MEITTVTHNGQLISVGNVIKVKWYNLVDDEEDRSNPIEEVVTIESFEPTDNGIKIHAVNKEGKKDYFYEDNLI